MIYPQNFEQKIEFNSIRELLKERCLSPLGSLRVEEMTFLTSYPQIMARLQQTDEFVRILQEEDFPCDFFFDVRPSLNRAAIPGMFMSEEELFNLRRSLDTLDKILRFLRGSSPDGEEQTPYPALRQLAGDTESFPQTIKSIDRILSPFGQIKDNASPTLQQIRSQLSGAANSISRTLQRILSKAQADGIVDKDTAPTLRDGRLVIPVAGALKRQIRGIVHDESATGKTVFIEPEEVVEANNRIRELEAEERREVIRILCEFTDALRPSIPSLLQSYEFLAEIDFTRAKAKFAILTSSLLPTVTEQPLIDWGTAIHPLLQLSLGKHGKKMVPLDISLEGEKKRILLISGPNAGGKSVCLKTVGLLQYMLQCGLLIPLHERSRAGIFQSLFIDIGDEQSIENDLSTYSSHLLNMKVMLKRCDNRSLILIDEFGGGTEPLIGGAIAQAVLGQLNAVGTYGIITTHYQNLKEMAGKTPGIINGAMLYDRQLMQPLFQLQAGNPGSSFAIEIARKTGLPDEVIREASDIVGQDYIQADKYLQDIVRDKRYWESKRQTIHQREKELEETITRLEAEKSEFAQKRKLILEQAKEEAREMLEESNAKIEKTIRSIVESKAEKEKTKEARKELSDFKKEIELRAAHENSEKVDRKMQQLLEREKRKIERREKTKNTAGTSGITPPPAQPPKESPLTIGDYVLLQGQNSVGRIVEIKGQQAISVFGTLRATVALSRLKRTTAPQQPKEQAATYLSRQTQESIYDKKLNFKQDIDVRGMRGDETLQAVTYFIDDAILLRMGRVRILHGTGNGILRTLIRQYLQTVPGVASFHDENIQFGGSGITVVDLE